MTRVSFLIKDNIKRSTGQRHVGERGVDRDQPPEIHQQSKTPRFSHKTVFAWLAVCLVTGSLLSWLSDTPIWVAAPIVAARLQALIASMPSVPIG